MGTLLVVNTDFVIELEKELSKEEDQVLSKTDQFEKILCLEKLNGKYEIYNKFLKHIDEINK
jgi:hypothetical protein